MTIDFQGNIWAVKNEQIYKLASKKWSVFCAIPDQAELAQSVLVNYKGEIWLGANTGLWHFCDGKWNIVLQKISVYCITQGVEDSLLAGTSSGIYLCDNHSIVEMKIDLPAPKVLSLCHSQNGDLYVGTAEGLLIYRNDTVQVWNMWNSGLPGQIVNQLVIDGERMWVGTSSGLSQFSLETSPQK